MDASDADAMPLPSEDTTPPVTKISEVMVEPCVESDILAATARLRECVARATSGSTVATALLHDPLLLRHKNDPCVATLCKQLGVPASAASTP
jgi:hypothetical protein